MLKIYTKENLDLELRKSDRVIALFYASWCPYCRSFVPVFNEKTAKLDIQQVIHVLLDDYDNPLWDDYDVGAVPTIIVFEKGKVCNRLNGSLGRGLPVSQFLEWLEELKS